MKRFNDNESGFSYIDVMCAIVILLIGILAMLSALTANLIRGFENEKRTQAKQAALSSLESVISVKEIGQAGSNAADNWKRLRNVQNVPAPEIDGVFLPGFRPVREDPGSDGLVGTLDDACGAPGTCTNPDTGIVNTSPVVEGIEREVVITDIPDPERPFPNPITRRRVDVTVRFNISGVMRQERSSTIITNYKVEKVS